LVGGVLGRFKIAASIITNRNPKREKENQSDYIGSVQSSLIE